VDLCYEKLIYDDVPHNLVKVLTDRMRDRALFACSASKAYSMTGWRCGWILGPKDVVSAANTLQGHSTSNVASISQKAAVEALTGSQEPVTAMLNEYRARRDKLMEWFSADPRFECVKPAGAFYLFPRVLKVLDATGIQSSAEFSQILLDEARVALTGGEGFGAPGFVRISYATSLDRLREGTNRILEFVNKRERGHQPGPQARQPDMEPDRGPQARQGAVAR
jgi:aspartate aminotransferase